jgi:GNAT superfamily N-acetyltransferase
VKIEKLEPGHAVAGFDCGRETLNRFLVQFAWPSQAANGSQTYVAIDAGAVIGYYTLVVGEVQHDLAPERMRKGLSRQPVPVMVLARLAIAVRRQGQGLGKWLLKDAIVRTLAVADIAGVRAFVIHAKDDAAKSYYQRFRFADGFSNPLHLCVLTKDLKALLA